MSFRLHLDIPFPEHFTQEQAVKLGNEIRDALQTDHNRESNEFGYSPNGLFISAVVYHKLPINYRLGFDSDRQRSNYLDINENGHCSNKKLTIS